MKKTICIILSIIVSAAIFFGCTAGDGRADVIDDSDTAPVSVSDIVYFSFYYGGGTTVNGGSSYSAEASDDHIHLVIKPDGVSDDDVLELDVGYDFLEDLQEVIDKNDIGSWNGFDKTDTGVLDGQSFNLSIYMENGDVVNASGYEAYPDGFSDAASDIEALFMGVYENVRPNKQKALEAYYNDVLKKDHDEITDLEIEYPFIAGEDSSFSYGEYKGSEGIVEHLITDIDDDGSEDMIVIYQKKKETPDGNAWLLSFEVYSADDSGEVLLTGGDVLDDSLFWNDGLYATVFLHSKEYSNERMIGYCVQYNYYASTKDKAINIKLYDFNNGKLGKVCDEWQGGPAKKKKWKYEDLSNFINIAEQYSFPASLKHWEEMPSDPVIDYSEIDPITVYLTESNCDGDFYETVVRTESGQTVEGYKVTGGITNYYN